MAQIAAVCRTVDTAIFTVPGLYDNPLAPPDTNPTTDGAAGTVNSTYMNCIINNVGMTKAGGNCHVCGIPDNTKNVQNNFVNCVVNNLPNGFMPSNWGVGDGANPNGDNGSKKT